MTDTTDTGPGPDYSVVGVTKTHARRAIAWLRDRSILAFYRAEDRSLNTWRLKAGSDATYQALHDALDATRAA